MSLSVSSVDQIRAKMPFKSMADLITDKPTFRDLHKLYLKLCKCAAQIPSSQGGGRHGHLRKIMNPNLSYYIAGQAWVESVDPCPMPSVAQARRYHHVEQTDKYEQIVNVSEILAQFVAKAVDGQWLHTRNAR